MEEDLTKRKDETVEQYRERRKQQQRVYYRNLDPVERIIRSSAYRSTADALEHSIEASDIERPVFCPVLGIKLKYEVESGRLPDSISLDRIDPSKGYVKGNVRIVSWRANKLKSDATPQELVLLGRDGMDNFHHNSVKVMIKCQKHI